jgi:putative MATE family efflux protein
MDEGIKMAEVSETQMSKKELRAKIFSMILPLTFENILQMTTGFVSAALIGWISVSAINSVSLAVRVNNIVWALFKGIGIGTTVMVAQAYGSNDYAKVRKIAHQALLSTLVLVVLLQQIIYRNAHVFISWFGAKGEVLEGATMHLKNISFGLPFLAIMLIVAGVMQGMGNAKTPAKIALIMNIVNVGLSWMFIFGNLGFPALGLRGAALGIILAQATAALIGLYILFNENGILRPLLNKSLFRFDGAQIVDVYKVGLPSSAESVFWNLSSIVLTSLILKLGTIPMAAHSQGLQAEAISYMPAASFALAATAFIGQALGASNPKLAKEYFKEIAKGSTIITSVSVVLLLIIPKQIMWLLTKDPEVIALGAVYLRLMALVQIPQNISGVINGTLRGAGYTQVPAFVSGTGIWLVRIPLSYFLALNMGMGIYGIWTAMCIDLIFRFILSSGFLLLKHKSILYKRNQIEGEEQVISTN